MTDENALKTRKITFKKVDKWMSLYCTVDYKCVLNDIITLYKKNDSEWKWSVGLWYYYKNKYIW